MSHHYTRCASCIRRFENTGVSFFLMTELLTLSRDMTSDREASLQLVQTKENRRRGGPLLENSYLHGRKGQSRRPQPDGLTGQSSILSRCLYQSVSIFTTSRKTHIEPFDTAEKAWLIRTTSPVAARPANLSRSFVALSSTMVCKCNTFCLEKNGLSAALLRR
jgi:hypothetical protein